MSFVHAQSKHGANRQESDAHELTEYVLDKMASTGNREQQGVTHGSWCKSQDEDKKSLASVKSRNFILDRAPSFATFGTNDDAHFATSSSKDGGPYCTWNYDQQSKDVTLSERELSSIMRKIDFRLIPVLMFIFFYTILDTSALVHSRLAGMTMTIHMNDGQYHTALVIYDIAHILFVLPAMWCMDRFGSKRWLSILVGIGGITMLCSGLVQTPIQMIVMRFILGALAAGMLPACLQTITLMYPRKNVQWRMALASIGGVIGGLVGSFIAFALTDIKSAKIQGWRMIFIIYGVITIIAAPLTYLMMPDSIQECNYLSSTQKVQYQALRSTNANEADTTNMTSLQKLKLFLSSLVEVKSWLAFIMLLAVNICFLGLTVNIPIMMREGFGFDARDAQVLPIPILLVTATLLLLLSWFSDRFEQRILFVAGPAFIGLIGFLGSLVATNGKIRYGLLFLGDLVGIALPGVQMVLAQNIVCDTKRSAALGVGGLLAGLGSIVASYLIWDKDAPRYFTAYSILASCCTIILLSSGALFLYLRRENLIKEKTINSRSVYHLSKEELRALGDKNPYFRFKY